MIDVDDGRVIGREPAVEMVADSIRRLDEPAGCVPPKTPKTTLLPPSVLPPSVQERSADKAVQTGTKAWLAVAAACC